MVDAILEYGVYDKQLKCKPKVAPARTMPAGFPKMVMPWAAKKAKLGGAAGDESLIQKPWELLETMAYIWLWQWMVQKLTGIEQRA